jgi:3-phenylpropionate/trans-cinnamate dioxygenase ferredoxin subunit
MGAHVVANADDIADGTAERFEVAGRSVCVVRIGDDFYALGDTCSHADVSLSEGDILLDECAIECWKHGSAFDLRTGEPQTLPATRPVPVYEIRVEGGKLVVEVS